ADPDQARGRASDPEREAAAQDVERALAAGADELTQTLMYSVHALDDDETRRAARLLVQTLRRGRHGRGRRGGAVPGGGGPGRCAGDSTARTGGRAWGRVGTRTTGTGSRGSESRRGGGEGDGRIPVDRGPLRRGDRDQRRAGRRGRVPPRAHQRATPLLRRR